MDAFSNRVIHAARETIQDRILDLQARLVKTPAEDYAGYKMRVGHIAGLEDALAVISQAVKDYSRSEASEEAAPMMGRRYEE